MTRKKQTDAGHMVDLSRIDPDKMYTRTEAGDLLGCGQHSVRDYAQRGLLYETMKHGRYAVLGSQLAALGKEINHTGGYKAWCRKRQQESQAETLAEAEARGDEDCQCCFILLRYDPCQTDKNHCATCVRKGLVK